MAGAVIFGVIEGDAEHPRLGYLAAPQAVTDDALRLAEPVEPTEVFRFAAPCAASGCRHFDGCDCRLARRTVQLLPIVTAALPPCRIRPRCRWWRQEGRAACLRCPQVVTDNYAPTDAQRTAADPDGA
jgi:hypothetical protein